MKRSLRPLKAALAVTATLVAASGCTFLAQLNDEFEVARDAGPIFIYPDSGNPTRDGGGDDGMDATMMMSRDAGMKPEDAAAHPDADAGPTTPEYCRAQGWHLDCDAGLVILPSPADPPPNDGGVADDAAIDSSVPVTAAYNGAPFVAIQADGTVNTFVAAPTSFAAPDVYIYTTSPDAGTSVVVASGAGSVNDVRTFDGEPTLVLTSWELFTFTPDTIRAFTVVDGSAAQVASYQPPSRSDASAAASTSTYNLLSFDGGTVRAYFFQNVPTVLGTFNYPSIATLDVADAADPGSSVSFENGIQQGATPTGFGVDIDGSTLLVQGTTTFQGMPVSGGQPPASVFTFVDSTLDASAIGQCGTPALNDIVPSGGGVIGVGLGLSGQTFLDISQEDGGTCTPLATLPEPIVQNGSAVDQAFLAKEDDGFTEVLFLWYPSPRPRTRSGDRFVLQTRSTSRSA